MPELAAGVERSLLIELEWHCRVALALADRLDEAMAIGDESAARRTACMLLERLERLREFLWPRPDASRTATLRRLVGAPGTPWASPLGSTATTDRLQLTPAPRGRWRCRLEASSDTVDLPATLAQVEQLWNRAAALLMGE